MSDEAIIKSAGVETEEAPAEERAPDDTRARKAGGRPADAGRLHPLVELTLARIREFMREPEVVFWVFAFPILLVCALGIAFRNTGPEKIPVAVERQDAQDAQADALFKALSSSGDVQPTLLSPAEAAQALRSGKVVLIVRPPTEQDAGTRGGGDAAKTSDASDSLRLPLPASPVYRYDPARPESKQARLAVDDALQRGAGRADIVRANDETFTEPGARYIDFLIPGLLGMNLMGSGLWGVGFAVVNARTKKLLKRFAATPMRRSHYLLSFVFSRLIFLVLEVAVVIAFAYFAFGFRVRGSWLEMAFLLLLGSMTFAGIGLLVAARPKTIEGVSGLMNLVMMPMWLLSGTFFSSARFPDFLQPFIKALPLTALNDSLRTVMNDGASVTTGWLAVLVLLAWCVVGFALALKVFRWQ
ncbi:MAG TPA: ABC transporter permease [Pyrinomonadaceae bacterium]|jgi:ABC-type multidrug transport system permease subunit